MISAYILNSSDDSIHPWRTPFSMSMLSVFPNSVLTVASWLVYSHLSNTIRCYGTPISLSITHSLSWSTQSKAFLQSMKHMYNYLWCSFVFSITHLRLAIWSRVSLPRLNPACSIGSSGIRNTSSLLCMIRRSTLLACEIRAIVR